MRHLKPLAMITGVLALSVMSAVLKSNQAVALPHCTNCVNGTTVIRGGCKDLSGNPECSPTLTHFTYNNSWFKEDCDGGTMKITGCTTYQPGTCCSPLTEAEPCPVSNCIP